MDYEEFERLSEEDKKGFFKELKNQFSELMADNAVLLGQVRLQRAQLKSLQVDISNAARKQCAAHGLSADETDDLISMLRDTPGGLRELRNIFETAIPCHGDSVQRRECLASILIAIGRSDAWSELMDQE